MFVFLTDHLGLAVQGWAPRTRAELSSALAAGIAADTLQNFLLPADVAAALAGADDVSLTVQLPPELDALPIEALVEGAGAPSARPALVRQLAGRGRPPPTDAAPAGASRGPLKVLVLTRDAKGIFRSTPEAGVELTIVDTDQCWDLSVPDPPTQVLVLAVSANLHAETVELMVRTAQRLPDLWIWAADKSDIESVLLLQAQGRAALLAPTGLAGEALVDALKPWLRRVAAGDTPARALRALPTPTAWRLYHAAPRPLCLSPAADSATADFGDDHRLVTALSFDLVGSTQLLVELGSEAYSEMLLAMHERSLESVAHHGGNVEARLGDDGSMACFGWPQAHEDTAVRAVEAALSMQAAVLDLPGRPQFRIGVATGRVAVRQGVPFGPAVHLAARLRERAAPGQIVTDEHTRRLGSQRFTFDEHALVEPLKGMAGLPRVWRLFGRVAPGEAGKRPLTRLVGREVELAELQEGWRNACRGGVVPILLHGEAGVGKSRLVQEFLAGIAGEGSRYLVVRGLTETQGSAFHALADALRQRLGLRHDDSWPAQQALVASALPTEAARTPALEGLTHLLEVAGPGGSAMSPHGVRRERLLASVADAIAAGAIDQPLALVVEDLQWVDPSTRELLERVAQTRRPVKLLLLATRRDECGDDSAVATLPGGESIALERLSPAASRWLVRESSNDALSRDLIARIADRAAGIPLFLEETARLAVELGGETEAVLAEVPAPLDALLMARLDRLGIAGKRLAQTSAVLGQEFPLALLKALVEDPLLPWPMSAAVDLEERLAPLLATRLLRSFSINGLPCLGFGHELLRDVGYLSIWQRDRQQVHMAAVRALRAGVGGTPQPQHLAHHLAGAGFHTDAIPLWEQAADTALSAGGNREALGHLRAALRSMASLPLSPEHARAELRLQMRLARRLIAADGYGADGVEKAYLRASALVDKLDDANARTKVQLGLESLHVMRGELDLAGALAAQALAGALAGGDLQTRLQARWALAHVRFHAGDSASALELMDDCLAEYRPDRARPAVVQDPGVMSLCYSAWALWELGRADAARERAARVLALAQLLGHHFSLAEAYGFAASVALFRGEIDSGLDWAERATSLSEEHGYTVWLAHARVVHGRLLALRGNAGDGLREMVDGYQQWISTGACITRPMYLSLIAETRLECSDFEGAARDLDEAQAVVDRTHERYHEAELLRLQGRVACARGRPADGEALLRRALEIASRQGKTAFSLRAAIALAATLADGGRRNEAKELLQEALSRMNEGLDTLDPRRARELLGKWGGRDEPTASARMATPAAAAGA